MNEDNSMAQVTGESLHSIANQIIDLVLRKNADYKDAWQSQGMFTSLIRLKDKLIRVETLQDGRQALVQDEDIEQTLIDIVGYGLLGILRYRWEKAFKSIGGTNSSEVTEAVVKKVITRLE